MNIPIGIDFGNNNCVVGVAKRGTISIATNEFSNRKTPTFVAYTDKSRFFGENAVLRHSRNAKNTIHDLKSLIETSTPTSPPFFTLTPSTTPSHTPLSVTLTTPHTPTPVPLPNLIASVFSSLRRSAVAHAGCPVEACVFAVPATFTEAQRRALALGARVAGLKVAAVISEGAAVALAYGLARRFEAETRVLFVDCGHGATSATLAAFCGRRLSVLRSARAPAAGQSFTAALEGAVLAEIERGFGVAPERVRRNAAAAVRLRAAVDRAKVTLCINREVGVQEECLVDDIDVSLKVTKEQFEEAIRPDVNSIVEMIKTLVADSKLSLKDISALELLGGGSHIPFLRSELERFFERPISSTCNAEETIAEGCTFRCAMESSFFRVREYKIVDCFPYAISASWGPVDADFTAPGYAFDESTVLFGPFSPLPAAKLVSLRRRVPFQIVFRYTAPPPGADAFIGRLVVRPAESDFAVSEGRLMGDPKIKAKIVLDENGSVEVRFVQVFKEVEIVVLPSPPVDGKDGQAGSKDGVDSLKDGGSKEGVDSLKDGSAVLNECSSKDGKASPQKTEKKTITTDIKFELTKPGPTEEEIQEMEAFEEAMGRRDELFVKLGEMTNDLESLALEAPAKVKAEWAGFISPEEEQVLLAELAADERWLYSPQTESIDCLPELENKLTSARRQIEAVVSRIRAVEEAAKKKAAEEEAAKRKAEKEKLKAEEEKKKAAVAQNEDDVKQVTKEEVREADEGGKDGSSASSENK